MRKATVQVAPQDRFNSWTVLGVPFRFYTGKHKVRCCVCKCDCGTVSPVLVGHLVAGNSRNCGCVRKRALPASARTHGESKTKLYKVWKGMRERCGNPKSIGYAFYGGKGVKVCPEWQDDFQAFKEWAVAAGWKPRLQIDRIDNDGNYEPGNCRIVTAQENCNNKRGNRYHEAWGESKTLFEWSKDKRCKVTYRQLRGRIKHGWAIEEALTVLANPKTDPLVTAFGESKTVAEWVRDPRCSVKASCLRMRLTFYKWEPERAITTPAKARP